MPLTIKHTYLFGILYLGLLHSTGSSASHYAVPSASAAMTIHHAAAVHTVAPIRSQNVQPMQTTTPSLVQRALISENLLLETEHQQIFKPSIDHVVSHSGQSFFAQQHQRFSRFLQALFS